MIDALKPQPTGKISQVGDLNTGDVTIHGAQISFQKKHSPDTEAQSTLSKLNAVLRDLQS